jgi:hypothetical protein
MFVDSDSQKDVSIPKTERLEMAPKRRNPGPDFPSRDGRKVV